MCPQLEILVNIVACNGSILNDTANPWADRYGSIRKEMKLQDDTSNPLCFHHPA